MFHSRSSNTKINRLHERALRLVYNDFQSTFDELLIRDKSFLIHHQNIQTLAIEIPYIFEYTPRRLFNFGSFRLRVIRDRRLFQNLHFW